MKEINNIENISEDLYRFEKPTVFEHLWHLESKDNRCPYCNKKLLVYYNDDHEMFINICKDKSCGYYSARVFMEYHDVNINLDMVVLPDYND